MPHKEQPCDSTLGMLSRLGNEIRGAREDAGLKLHEAAAKARMSPTTWGRIERGAGHAVRGTTYKAIERVLGWEAGSIAIVLEGGDPVSAATAPTLEPPARPLDRVLDWETSLVDEIWRASHLDIGTKEDLAERAHTLAAKARVLEDRLRRSAS